MILENTIKKASELLKNHNIPSYELDAEIILSEIMKVKREFLMLVQLFFLRSSYCFILANFIS